jgi:hypothetical protein
MLIAFKVYPLMTVYMVHGPRKGSKHVINFPQNVSHLANVLLQKPEDIPLIFRRANLNDDKHYDFRVRRGKVSRWLKRNHKWYRDITISNDMLEQLPIDDNMERLFVRQLGDLPLPEIPPPPQASENTLPVAGGTRPIRGNNG